MTKSELEITRAKFKETMERQRAAAVTDAPRPLPASEDVGASQPVLTAEKTGRVARPSIRLIDEDLLRVRAIMGHALTLNETLNTTEILRLALHEWDYKKLTAKKISEIRSQDGRRKSV